jgi:hypothetical protein
LSLHGLAAGSSRNGSKCIPRRAIAEPSRLQRSNEVYAHDFAVGDVVAAWRCAVDDADDKQKDRLLLPIEFHLKPGAVEQVPQDRSVSVITLLNPRASLLEEGESSASGREQLLTSVPISSQGPGPRRSFDHVVGSVRRT